VECLEVRHYRPFSGRLRCFLGVGSAGGAGGAGVGVSVIGRGSVRVVGGQRMGAQGTEHVLGGLGGERLRPVAQDSASRPVSRLPTCLPTHLPYLAWPGLAPWVPT
jgi:hypothetical protein